MGYARTSASTTMAAGIGIGTQPLCRSTRSPCATPILARLADAAARIDISTLIVRGRQSDIVSDAGVADMKRLFPHAATVDVGAAGHMVAGDDNDVFTASLEQFLTAVAGR
jgi:pimeloyl-ACP methyl ester carboxylesterase